MFLYIWAAMTVAAMTPVNSYAAAPRMEPVITPAAVVQTRAAPAQRTRKRKAPAVIAAPAPAPREIMTLGWADDDDVPIF